MLIKAGSWPPQISRADSMIVFKSATRRPSAVRRVLSNPCNGSPLPTSSRDRSWDWSKMFSSLYRLGELPFTVKLTAVKPSYTPARVGLSSTLAPRGSCGTLGRPGPAPPPTPTPARRLGDPGLPSWKTLGDGTGTLPPWPAAAGWKAPSPGPTSWGPGLPWWDSPWLLGRRPFAGSTSSEKSAFHSDTSPLSSITPYDPGPVGGGGRPAGDRASHSGGRNPA
mmetsp:Transcript_5057/g.12449  ORF Transcript_5057/g.12449 Transcript_5057/m.12449 type:complete len:223 (+) Transcript_5057:1835-2503(+)